MITVPRTSDGLQPLCGIYQKTFLPIAEVALKAGNYKLDALFPMDSTNVLDMESKAMRDLGFDPAMFDNLNTREDYERVRKQKSQVPDTE